MILLAPVLFSCIVNRLFFNIGNDAAAHTTILFLLEWEQLQELAEDVFWLQLLEMATYRS